MNDEIRDLDRDVVGLKISNAELAVQVKGLTKEVADLKVAVTALTDLMNKSKGAIWVVVFIAGSIGATVSVALKKVLGIV